MLQAITDFISKVTRGEKIHVGGSDAQWRKVSELKVGVKIAVPKSQALPQTLKTPQGWPAYKDSPGVEESGSGLAESDVLWDEIVSIKRLSPERVWDIEVEGTHNFVAGHMIETPYPKIDRILTDEPLRGPPREVGDMLSKDQLKIGSGKPNKWFGGIFAHNTYLNGNVGIGTSSPSYKLDVAGAVRSSAGGFIFPDGTTQNTAAGTGSTYWVLSGNNIYNTNAGSVGVGTSSPTALLDLKGNTPTALTGTIAVTNLSATVTGTTTAFTTELAAGDAIKISGVVYQVSSIASATSLTLSATYAGSTASGLTGYKDPNLFTIANGFGTNKVTVDKSGNVGLGTTAPLAKLHVEGQCVTGDTLLKRKRRRKRSDGTWEEYWEDVRIDQIQAGDEIQTLDEETGGLIVSKVKALMDMGTKTTFKLTTIDGKTIRTTAEHPYLIRNLDKADTGFFHDLTYRTVENFGRKFYHRVLEGKTVEVKGLGKVHFSHEGFEHIVHEKKSRLNIISRILALPKVLPVLEQAENFSVRESETVNGQKNQYWAFNGIVDSVKTRVVIRGINGGEKHFYSVLWLGEEKENVEGAVSGLSHPPQRVVTLQRRVHDLIVTFIDEMSRSGVASPSVLKKFFKVKWVKVRFLKAGMEIATAGTDNRLSWQKIEKIEKVGQEQVYDIEVENTHNFVGNGIVAHNTYLNGNVGIGTIAPSYLLDVAGNARAQSNLYIGTGGGYIYSDTGSRLAVPNDFYVQATSGNTYLYSTNTYLGNSSGDTIYLRGNTFTWTGGTGGIINSTGNVGIGDTTPTNKLDVTGAIGISDTTVIDASRNLVNIGTITSGLINGQTISAAANFTGTVTAATSFNVTNTVLTTNRLYMNSGTNLHLDPFSTGSTYLNYYAGTGGTNFCNGANVCNASISSAGAITGTSLNVGAGAITSGLINGQTISSAANFTGTARVTGDFTQDTILRTAVMSRTMPTGNAGDTVEIGTLTNNGVGMYVKVYIYNHSSGNIISQEFSAYIPAYTTATTNWLEIPITSMGTDYTGTQRIAIDIQHSANTTSAPIYLRLRMKVATATSTPVNVKVETNATFTPTSATGTAGVVDGYLAGNSWQFPVSNGQAWVSSTQGLFIQNAGNVGIGDISPTNKLDVTGAIGISDTTVIDASRNLVNIGTITSGLINGQTISSAANFTGTLTAASTITAPTFSGALSGNATTATTATNANACSNDGQCDFPAGAYVNSAGNIYGVGWIISSGDLRARNGYIYLNGSDFEAIRGIDNTYLRLNQAGQFLSGVYTPLTFTAGGIITGSSFTGAGTGLTGTAASLTVGAATTATNVSGGSVNATTGAFSGGVTLSKNITAGQPTPLNFSPGSNDGAAPYIRFSEPTTGTFWDIQLTTAGGLALDRSDSEKFRIDQNGNVGIGTTGPGRRLQIDGIDGDSGGSAGITITSKQGALARQTIFDVGPFTSTANGVAMNILHNGVSKVLFVSDSASSASNNYINSGNVGIGTTSPVALLDLKGNTPTALTGTIAVTNLSATVTGTTTAFTTELNAGDAIKISGVVYQVSSIASATSLTLTTTYAGTTASGLTGYKDPSLFTIANGFGTNKLTVDKSGNVGVGTTAPTAGYKLDVNGAVNVTGNTLVSGSLGVGGAGVATKLGVQGTTTNSALTMAGRYFQAGTGTGAGTSVGLGYADGAASVAGISGYYDGTGPALGLFTGASNTQQLTILSGGNVGIGTTGPNGKLDINTTVAGTQRLLNLIVPNTIGNNSEIGFQVASNIDVAKIAALYTAGGQIGLAFSTYNSGIGERVRIDPAGNVGIGTTGPSNKLHINGAYANALGELIIDATSSHSIIDLRTTDATNFEQGIRLWRGGVRQAEIYSLNGDQKLHFDIGSGDVMVLQNNGNVGIGTTGPSAKLETSVPSIDATVLQEVARLSTTGRSAIGGTNNRGTLLAFSDGNNFTLTGAVGGIRQSPSGDYNGALAFYTNNTGAGNATAVTQLTEQMRITNAGNVGIGTTGPGSKLDVQGGNINTSGTVTATGGNSGQWNTAYTHSQDVTGAVHGAVSANTANMIVRRDASGNFSAGTITATTFSGALSGNATTATTATNLSGSIGANQVTAAAFPAGGLYSFASNTNANTSYSVASLQLRESNNGATSGYTPPHLAFHWGGVVASQISIESGGRIAILNNPGTGYENLIANVIYGAVITSSSYVQAYSASTAIYRCVGGGYNDFVVAAGGAGCTNNGGTLQWTGFYGM